ncbi:MAG: three-Cys-motif partner protein TcmP [Pseudonocardiaceae bacterium]|nr:MAG: three-Cys-motif partner protein TcmP [Pseudonocardiaceae bacterium]
MARAALSAASSLRSTRRALGSAIACPPLLRVSAVQPSKDPYVGDLAATVCIGRFSRSWSGGRSRVSANESFFLRRKAAAAFKHGILLSYPPLFASKAGSVTNGKVVFLDGYAGQGRYDDDSPGSPLLFVQAARANPRRNVTGIFIEQHPTRYASLCRVLDEADPDGVVLRVVREGDLSELLPELLPVAAGAALFAFLDPFGTALDLNQLRTNLLRRPGRAPTEVLLHFSVSTIARMGGILSAGRARGGLSIPEQKTVARADAFLGGDWWHPEFDALRDVLGATTDDGSSWVDLDEVALLAATNGSALVTATDVAMRVAHRFCDRLGQETGYRTVAMPVRPEQGRAPKYVLVLFTKNDHGVWSFADTLGRAGQRWQQALHEERARADAARIADYLGGDPGLFDLDDLTPDPPPPFDPKQYELDNRDRWVEVIANNLYRLFAIHGSGLRLVDHVDDVYGNVLGQAWEKHVRAAVRRLHNSELILDDGRGDDFWRRPIQVKIPRHRSPPPGDSLLGVEPASGEEAS